MSCGETAKPPTSIPRSSEQNRITQRLRSPDQTRHVLQDERNAQRRDHDVDQRHPQRAQRSVDRQLDDHGGDAAADHPDHQNDHERHTDHPEGRQASHRADHQDFALGEMKDVGRADNHRDAERDEAVDAPDRQAADDALDELLNGHDVSRWRRCRIVDHASQDCDKRFCIRMQEFCVPPASGRAPVHYPSRQLAMQKNQAKPARMTQARVATVRAALPRAPF